MEDSWIYDNNSFVVNSMRHDTFSAVGRRPLHTGAFTQQGAISRVGLMLTERCNVACRHCWVDSGPTKAKNMTLEEGKHYIGQAMEFSTLEWISFTGGEPFLLGEQLVELVAYASKRGLKTECVTNGFWAQSEQGARKRLRPLRAAGLEVLNISADAFHLEFIPEERIRNGVKAALHLGVKVVIMCATAKSSKPVGDLVRAMKDEDIRIIRPNREPPGFANSSVLWVESGFLPVGRAMALPRSEWVLDPQASFEGGCPFVLRDITITPGGHVRACCSAGALTHPLDIGNANQQGLTTLIEGAKSRPLIKILVREGPRGLLRRLDNNVHFELGKYVSKCHLCFTVLSDPRIQDVCLMDGGCD